MSSALIKREGSWSKRFSDEQVLEKRRPRRYYYRLESESSRASEEDTESVCSLQDRETDVVRDTTDTESRLDSSEYDVEIEYEVASLSEGEHDYFGTSSGPDEDIVALAAVAAAGAICHSSCETASWVTDGEDSDTSSMDEISQTHKDFAICMQCKTANKNPLFAFCEKCYQEQSCRQCKKRKTFKCFPLCNSCYKDRKRFLPPRPRRKKRTTKTAAKPVKLAVLRSCLNGLSSQDSGVGSSQECPQLDLDQIVVPEHLKAVTSTGFDQVKDGGPSCSGVETNIEVKVASSRKRRWSESSSSDYETRRVKNGKMEMKDSKLVVEQISSQSSDDSKSLVFENVITDFKQVETINSSNSSRKRSHSDDNNTDNDVKRQKLEHVVEQNHQGSDLCMFCNSAPKNSIFIHTNMAHNCCCYKCAVKTLNTIKRCPICNLSVSKVLKMYTI